MPDIKVGFIGLGNMGMHMARNVLKAGFPLVVWNRTRAKAEQLAQEGADLADSPADLARRVDVVHLCLASPEANDAVFFGEKGLMDALRPGQVVVDHSTVSPDDSRRWAAEAGKRGASFLDAPISGGPTGAEAGTLAIMVGGPEPAFQQDLPVLRAMGQTIVLMGPNGAGSVTKLVNQVLVGVHTLASCEALLLGIKGGVDPNRLMEVLKGAWGYSRMLERNAPFIINRQFGPSAAPIRNMVKDLGIIVEMARQMGISLPATRVTDELNRRASQESKAEHDITALYTYLEQGQA